MAPRGVSNWRRPYTSIYNDNYRYGNSLYSDTLSDIEKRYSNSISKTQLRSDRPDISFATFAGSNLMSSPTPGDITRETARSPSVPLTPVRDLFKGSTFESRLSSALHSPYADDEAVDAKATTERGRKQGREQGRTQETQRPQSLYDDAIFWTLPRTVPKATETRAVEFDSSISRRKQAKETPTNGPSSTAWRGKSNELQGQVDDLEKSMSDSSCRLRSELSTLKSKYHTEISDLGNSVEQSSQQTNELQRTIKRQANQLQELQSAYDDVQRNLQNTVEEMGTWQNRCKSLKKEMDRLREEVEQAMLKKKAIE